MAAAPTRATLYAAPNGVGAACTQAAPCGLDAAQRTARRAAAAHADVSVLLADGVYRRTSTWRFGADDSGSAGHPVTWTAAPGAHPVISGGFRVSGWTRMAGSDVWSAPVPAGTRTRQVYLNGMDTPVAQATQAALGISLSTWDAAGFHASGATATWLLNLAKGLNPTQLHELEFAWTPMRPTDWAASECPVDSIAAGASAGTATVTMAQPCWNNLTNKSATVYGGNSSNVTPYNLAANTGPTTIDNARALLHPGQWFLDNATNTLYYQPTPGQQMSTVDVEVPRVESLVDVSGTLNQPVHDITFSGIRFTTATWNAPSTPTGFAQVQAGLMVTQPNKVTNGVIAPATQGECGYATPTAGSCPWGAFSQPLANVQLTAARGVSFLSDRFDDLGGNGLAMRYGSDHNLVRGSVFTEIGASAVWLGCAGDPTPGTTDDPASGVIADCSADPTASAHDPIGDGEIMTGNTVDNNVLYHDAIDYLGTTGITLMFTRHTTIAHNDVFAMPYDGLTSGAWQGHVDNVDSAPTHSDQTSQNINSDNTISDNHFHDNMQVFTGDGGEIYTEGHQGATVLNGDGSVDATASFAHGLAITGNVFDTNTPNSAYATAPDVGSQWIDETGNVEWRNAYSFSCHWPVDSASRLAYTHNWAADGDDSVCATDNSNTTIPHNPGPADVPHDVLANAGPTAAYQSVEAAVPARLDYSGSSPANGSTPAQVLVVGAGFTRSTPLTIGGVPAHDITFLNGGFLIATVPPGAASTVVTLGPPAPTVTSPTPGSVLPQSPTTIAGTAQTGNAVAVAESGQSVCTARVAANNTWSCRPGVPLGDGAHTLSVTQTDAAGYTSAPTRDSFYVGAQTVATVAKIGFTGSFGADNAYSPGPGETVTGSIDRRAGAETVQSGQGVALTGGNQAIGFRPATDWGGTALSQNFLAKVTFTPQATQAQLGTIFGVGGNLSVRYRDGQLQYGFSADTTGGGDHFLTAPAPAAGQQHELDVAWDATTDTMHVVLDGTALPAVSGEAAPPIQVLNDMVAIGNDVHPSAQNRGFVGTVAAFRIGAYDGPYSPGLLGQL
ncbi:Ig-like domain-containing protein [Kutzneria sp. CA-103260]|uniref:Ig-like domain-containing protein n=1 Tax=Kutzneria sp. CA-103260 TaxID=2802641 RepID=UPI001BA554CD|nr:Ig-like domain-containing protein [Kutzneria sp. CA-103260]